MLRHGQCGSPARRPARGVQLQGALWLRSEHKPTLAVPFAFAFRLLLCSEHTSPHFLLLDHLHQDVQWAPANLGRLSRAQVSLSWRSFGWLPNPTPALVWWQICCNPASLGSVLIYTTWLQPSIHTASLEVLLLCQSKMHICAKLKPLHKGLDGVLQAHGPWCRDFPCADPSAAVPQLRRRVPLPSAPQGPGLHPEPDEPRQAGRDRTSPV